MEVSFQLKMGQRTMDAGVNLPEAPVRTIDLLPVLLPFASAIVDASAADVEEEGKHISCRAGCGACCRQLVPISRPEALYLAAHLDSLPPERRTMVRERFRVAVERLRETGMRERLTGFEDQGQDVRREIGMDYFRLGIACPFLEEESCGIYEHRPMACREYLVTSPAANCADPHPETIDTVPLYARPSVILYRFGDGKGEDRPRFLPLVFALEWAAAHSADTQAELPAPEMFRNFVRKVAE